ncbi:cysteine desulfurase [Actinospica durhamensis]|uniref:cysteine desulfurase n=2 Tax=Actinospica durhamensis TaxID=1508375 RepID=A0A941EHY5_9ACTN|nr:cysteine desulfurase [Actinospica durhamensis]
MTPPVAAAPVAPPVAPPAAAPVAAPFLPPATPPSPPRTTLPFAPVRPTAARLPLAPIPAAAPPAAPGTGTYYFLTESGPPAGSPVPPAAPSSPYYFVHEPPRQQSVAPDPHPPFDVLAVRRDFPILTERVNGRPLIWLDNAATTQKPHAVIDRLVEFYSHENSNIHRAAHELAARATDAYEHARRTVARFLGAGGAEEIVFVRGTTEAINLVANAWGNGHVRAGDEIVISHLEHHANIVPWQLLAERTGAVIKVIPVDESGQILLEEYAALLSERTRLVSVTQVSNALGTVVPVKQVIELGHRAGARVLIDAAQSAPHMPTNVTALDADFLAFSGHKLFGPTGIGVLYGKREALEEMAPWEGGGNMIVDVTLERSVFQPPPGRFEAGTGNIADAVGLAAAIEYVERIGLPGIAAYEHTLVEHATEGLRRIPGLRLIGTAPEKAGIVSFVLDGHQPAEVGTELNRHGIAVRAGHHCAQPILRRFGLEATVRPSFAFYNTHDEVDALIAAVRQLSAGGRRS